MVKKGAKPLRLVAYINRFNDDAGETQNCKISASDLQVKFNFELMARMFHVEDAAFALN